MNIYQNAYVDDKAAYFSSGGIIPDTARIPTSHLMEYWQQDNCEIPSAQSFKDVKIYKEIDAALYVGRIPSHFGHFLMEGLPRLCDAIHLNIPIIGHIAYGKTKKPEHLIQIKSIEWMLKNITKEKFYRVKTNKIYKIKNLYISDLPILLSQHCAEPWRMTPLIDRIVTKARKKFPKYKDNNRPLYLKRIGEEINFDGDISDPTTHVAEQIARVSYASELHGKAGSNSHVSMFAKFNAFTNWKERHDDFIQTNRNQLICDIIKTFNKF